MSCRLLAVLIMVAMTPARASPRADLDPPPASVDESILAQFVSDLRSDGLLPGVHSFILLRDGRLLVEAYFDGWHRDRLHAAHSVTKSITSALVGIAISRGEIEGPQQRLLDLVSQDWIIRNLDERKQAIRPVDLLTMRSGTDYHETGYDSPHSRLNRLSSGWGRFYLDRPMETKPGTQFRYDSGAVIVMSNVLAQQTGMHADAYAERFLFDPLGIESHRWYRNDEGQPHTGGGLYLRPLDMAKLGQLYLQDRRKGKAHIPWHLSRYLAGSTVRIAHVLPVGVHNSAHAYAIN